MRFPRAAVAEFKMRFNHLFQDCKNNDRLVDECDGGVFVFRRAVESVNKAVNKTKLGKRPIC